MPASPTITRDQTAGEVRDRLHAVGLALLQAGHGPLTAETITATLRLLEHETPALVKGLGQLELLDRLAGHMPSRPGPRTGGGDEDEAARLLREATTLRRDAPLALMSQVE